VSPASFASRLADRLDPPDPPVFERLGYEPTPRQQEFHSATEFDVLYGGAAGGGKLVRSSWRESGRAPDIPVFV
jgi:hypothetical protein